MSGTFALYRYPCVTSASCTCHVLRGAAVSLEPAGSDPNPRCIPGIRVLVDGTGKKRPRSTVSASWWTGPEKSHICPRNPRSGGRSAVFEWSVHEMLVLVDERLIAEGLSTESYIRWMCLLADHDVEDHVIGVLHADRADTSEILNGLLNVFFNDAVVLRDADATSCKDCRLKSA